MIKQAAIMWIFAMTILTGLFAAQTATPPKQEQKVFVVPANRDWTDTGFVLKSADRVTAKASGRIYFNERPNSPVGSNGLEGDYKSLWPEDSAACTDPLPKESHGSLLARINDEVFKLGLNTQFSGKAGRLFLGINDCTLTGKLGNTGNFGVNIKIERDAIGAKK